MDVFQTLYHINDTLPLIFITYISSNLINCQDYYHLLAKTAFLESSSFFSSTLALEKIVRLKFAAKSYQANDGTIIKGP